MVNWKLRFKNKVTLISLIALCLTIVYTIFGMFGITPSVPQDEIKHLLGLMVEVLVVVGVVTDPTTEGVKDSEQAMGYDEPKKGE